MYMEVIEGLSQVLTLEGRSYVSYIRTQVAPRSKHFDYEKPIFSCCVRQMLLFLLTATQHTNTM